MSNKVNSFELFEQDFEEGDQVIIVNDLDLLDWGSLTYNEKGFTLASGLRPARHYTWNQCVFMAKDGFPVRKIFGRFPRGQDITDKQIYFRAGFAAEVIEKLEREVFEIRNLMKQHIVYSPHIIKSIKNMNEAIALLYKEAEPMKEYWKEDMIIKSYDKAGRTIDDDDDDRDIYDIESSDDEENDRIGSIRFGCPFETEPATLQLFNAGGFGPLYDLTPQEEILRMVHKNGAVAQLWQLTEVFDFG